MHTYIFIFTYLCIHLKWADVVCERRCANEFECASKCARVYECVSQCVCVFGQMCNFMNEQVCELGSVCATMQGCKCVCEESLPLRQTSLFSVECMQAPSDKVGTGSIDYPNSQSSTPNIDSSLCLSTTGSSNVWIQLSLCICMKVWPTAKLSLVDFL